MSFDSFDTMHDLLKTCFEAGQLYGITKNEPIYIFRKDDGSHYASHNRVVGHYTDKKIAQIDCRRRSKAAVEEDVACAIGQEMLSLWIKNDPEG